MANHTVSIYSTHLLPLAMGCLAMGVVLLPISDSWADTRFGEPGTTGASGQDGREGSTETPIQINADGRSQTYNLRGGNGEDGTDGSIGTDASDCEQPQRPEFSLIGASGGRGGRGGNGGNGGDGGSVTIFFDNIANLRQIQIMSDGGKGGRAGRGQVGGRGCACTIPQWTVSYCTYERFRRPVPATVRPSPVTQSRPTASVAGRSRSPLRSSPPAPLTSTIPPVESPRVWSSDGSSSGLCRRDGEEYGYSSETYIQNWRQYRNRPWISGDWEYRMERRPSYSKTYTCQSGTNGAPGRNGTNGRPGDYGTITLVPVPSIPQERLTAMALLGNAVNQTETLVANVWETRSGLRQLLASGSQVSNNYTFLVETLRPRHRIEWGGKVTPQSLGIELVPVGAKLSPSGKGSFAFSWQIPDTIEYETFRNGENIEVARINGGFAPERLSKFTIADTLSGQGQARELTLNLVDRGNLRGLLRSSEIQLICESKQSAAIGTRSDDYQERQRITFPIPTDQQQPSQGMKITKVNNMDQYEIPVGRYCYPWLKPGYEVRIKTEIKQTIKAGRTIGQNLELITQIPQ